MKSTFNEFLDRKFYRILYLIVTFLFFLTSIGLIIFYWKYQKEFFSFCAYDFIINQPEYIMPEFSNQIGLISFLYHAFPATLYLFSAFCLITFVISIFSKTGKLSYFSLCLTFLILLALTVIETCSLNVIDYRGHNPFPDSITFLDRFIYYTFFYYTIGATSIILIFLPLFYMALKVDGKKKFLYIALFYFAALACFLLLSSIDNYSYIIYIFFNVSTPFAETTLGVFSLFPFSLFTILSAILVPVKSIKIKVPIICVLIFVFQILYISLPFMKIYFDEVASIIIVCLTYIGVPTFPLTVALYLRHYVVWWD